jgi:hypothetical protein
MERSALLHCCEIENTIFDHFSLQIQNELTLSRQMFAFRNEKPLRRLSRKWQDNVLYILVRMGMDLIGSKMYSVVGFDVSDVEYSGSSTKDLENAGLNEGTRKY